MVWFICLYTSLLLITISSQFLYLKQNSLIKYLDLFFGHCLFRVSFPEHITVLPLFIKQLHTIIQYITSIVYIFIYQGASKSVDIREDTQVVVSSIILTTPKVLYTYNNI